MHDEEDTQSRLIDSKYRLVRLVGRGGMGEVWEAENCVIGKRVALKFIDADLARSPDGVERFEREARATGSIESSHIVQVFDVGRSDDGRAYIVMELLRGETLGQKLARLGVLDPIQTLHLIMQTLRGLHRAHQLGIIHRDLKPDNIFLAQTEGEPINVKLLDFGISKFVAGSTVDRGATPTERGVVLGTPNYMAPEQARSAADLDARADIWSMGTILYECLSGKRAFTGETYEQVIIAICTTSPTPLSELMPKLPTPLSDIVMRAMSPRKEDRYASATELLNALQQVVAPLLEAAANDESSTVQAVTSSPTTGAAQSRDSSDELLVQLPPSSPLRRAVVFVSIALGLAALGTYLVFYVIPSLSSISASSGAIATPGFTAMEKWASETPRGPEQARMGIEPTRASSSHQSVRVETNSTDAVVKLDGVTLVDGTFDGRPGQTHMLSVTAPGFEPYQREVTVRPELSLIRVQLERLVERKDLTNGKPVPGPRPSSRSNVAGDLELKTSIP